MTRRYWTEAEIELLRRFYADALTADLAAALGRTIARVQAKANALGLRKSLELIAETARRRTQAPGHGSKATRFNKGQTPHNKGLKRPEGWAPGRMAQSQFKPGNKPHTWLPVGTFRIVEGVLERKFSDEPGPPGARWRSYARLVWEAAHGPMPPGHAVVFKPGRQTTDPELVTLDAVELIRRQELMRRNNVHTQYPAELVPLVRLRAAITRQINRKADAAANEQEADHA